MSRLTFGTPPSPETRLCRHGDPQCPCQDGDMCHYEGADPMTPPRQSESFRADFPDSASPISPPIVAIRPSGPHSSELYVRTGDGAQVVIVPLSWGHLMNLNRDVPAAIDRYEEKP